MKLKLSFTIQINEAAVRERIAGFFTRAGYNAMPSSETGLEFKRGSLQGMFFSFDPDNWECRATADLSDVSGRTDISIEYTVSNDPIEHSIAKQIWTDEFHRLQAYVQTGELTQFDSKEPKRKVTGFVLDIIGIFLGILIILLAAALIVIYLLTDTRPPLYLTVIDGMIIAGGVVFVGWRLWRKVRRRTKK